MDLRNIYEPRSIVDLEANRKGSNRGDAMNDPINPKHYKHLPAEAIDIIEAAIARAPSNEAAYLQGQVLKYLLRCWSKKGVEDLRKAKWYLDRLVDSFDEALAEASGANETPSEPTKRYRDPTQADLANGPIDCEVRDSKPNSPWHSRILLEILSGSDCLYRVQRPDNRYDISRWPQCRIEATE